MFGIVAFKPIKVRLLNGLFIAYPLFCVIGRSPFSSQAVVRHTREWTFRSPPEAPSIISASFRPDSFSKTRSAPPYAAIIITATIITNVRASVSGARKSRRPSCRSRDVREIYRWRRVQRKRTIPARRYIVVSRSGRRPDRRLSANFRPRCASSRVVIVCTVRDVEIRARDAIFNIPLIVGPIPLNIKSGTVLLEMSIPVTVFSFLLLLAVENPRYPLFSPTRSVP